MLRDNLFGINRGPVSRLIAEYIAAGKMSGTLKTVTGNPISVSDALAKAVESLTVGFSPKQDLNGYSNPWPGGGGKNLLENTATSQTINEVTFTVNDDGSVTASGTADGFVILNLNNITLTEGDYIASGGLSSSAYINVAGKVNATTGDASFSVESGGETLAVRIYIATGTAVNGTFYPMIRKSTESDSTYAPYSNICPISGWQSVGVTRAGKNLLDMDNVPKSMLNCYDAQGEAQNRIGCVIELPPGTYTVTAYPRVDEGAYIYMNVVSEDNQFVRFDYLVANNTNNSRIVTLTSGQKIYIYDQQASAPGATTKFNLRYFQIESGSTATAYAPYTGESITVSFGGTYYSGTVDVGSGVVSVTHAIKTFGQYDYWTKSTSANNGFYSSIIDLKYNCALICNQLKYTSDIDVYKTQYGYCFADSTVCVSVDPDVCGSTVEELKAWIADNPLTIVYELAEPLTISLDPQTLTMLRGSNTVWTDADSLTMQYKASS